MQNNLSCWWKHGIVYHIYPQSFKDANRNGIGNLQGIIQKMDYLTDLGITAVWLSPIYESPMIDGGYDITDHKQIDPVFGRIDDFRQLLEAAHQRNIRIIMDLVLNHTSDQHPWFVESRSSKENVKRDWYIWQAPKNRKRPNNWMTNFGKSAWQYDRPTGEYYYHSFFAGQPDLNWRNPEVKIALFDIVKFWLDLGVDGFRLDVINMLIKDKLLRRNPINPLNDNVFNRNQPEVYEILKEFRSILDQYPNQVSIGEIYALPPGRPQLATSFLGNGSDMLHLVFDFSLVYSLWNASAYYKVVDNYYRNIPAGAWSCFFLSNHDVGRCTKRFGFELYKYAKAKLRAVMLLTLRGTPFIYYGDEIGMENAFVPKRKINDLYGQIFWPFYQGRDGSRTPMQWSDGVYADFSSEEPWLPINKNYRKINVENESQDPQSVLSNYTKLIALRNEQDVLQSGEIEFLSKGKQNILAYSRYSENKKIIVILNFSLFKKKWKLNMDNPSKILFSTHQRPESKNTDSIPLCPFEGLILEIKTG
ncbi:MAG: hypothetical protein LBS25_08330 [Candidatus Symbiothrix sp.]|jgi:alpha-glucosidase|nr:hypothetical protein [Candidatus Symbiothrix sp.]